MWEDFCDEILILRENINNIIYNTKAFINNAGLHFLPHLILNLKKSNGNQLDVMLQNHCTTIYQLKKLIQLLKRIIMFAHYS